MDERMALAGNFSVWDLVFKHLQFAGLIGGECVSNRSLCI